ncbi:hypothetical protein [Pseudomarimonas arenosa]|uniref:Right handed beta helix domain-containing protein n=1 Tax=Pseudomarimonas arenosa TaxID=2774145 RepID=A0AAW3ZM93_9GAMM|nr:hypothetical protein [Pseudomarimonas arenosa]MBD8527268.1 hypothetical protein [Pseudomarimonas arenosa]
MISSTTPRWLAGLAGLIALSEPALALTDLDAEYANCRSSSPSVTVTVGPSDDYQAAINAASAGTRVQLAAGDYSNGLRIYDLHGAAGNCIVIEGPETGVARLIGAPLNGIRNVVQIRNSSYVLLRRLEIDGTGTTDLDALKSDATIAGAHSAAWSHHISLEQLHIHDFDFSQQQVGISTKGPAWNWVLRNNRIERVGTGIYLGNSNGAEHFVHGLIEFNLIRDSVGYNAQIKHQFAASRPSGSGFETLPATGRTVIRHNVFHKSGNSSGGGNARPNLLLGTFPLSGNGSNDDYVVYGNFFYQNPTGVEALFQGEGNLALYANLFFNDQGPAIAIQPQNGELRRIRLLHNTVLSSGSGIFVSGSVNAMFDQDVRGNAVFSDGTAISGGSQSDNVSDTLDNADLYLQNPQGQISGVDRLDLHPLDGALSGSPIDATPIAGLTDAERDFNDAAVDPARRGAYASSGVNPGWPLALVIKDLGPLDRVFYSGFE